MDNIEFETDKIAPVGTYATTPKKSGIVNLLMKMGVKTEAAANYILIGISGALLAFTAYYYMGMFSEPEVDQAALERQAVIDQLNETRQ